jgi:nitrite reductase (NADH) small subunit
MNAVSITSETESWITVCQASELIDNVGLCALVDDHQVAIFKLSGSDELYAIDNHDPFSNANVLSRGMCGDLKDQPVVASPIYKNHFNLKTGLCLEDDSVKLTVYSVRVVDNEVQVANSWQKRKNYQELNHVIRT